MIRILKEGIDIHEGIVTAYRRRRHRRTSYPNCIWSIEKDGVLAAWASEVAFTADIKFHGGIEPAVSRGMCEPFDLSMYAGKKQPPRCPHAGLEGLKKGDRNACGKDQSTTSRSMGKKKPAPR